MNCIRLIFSQKIDTKRPKRNSPLQKFPPADNLSLGKDADKEFTFDVEVKLSFRSPEVFRTVSFL